MVVDMEVHLLQLVMEVAVAVELDLVEAQVMVHQDRGITEVQEVDKQISDTRLALTKEETSPVKEETTDQNPTYAWVASELAKAKADMSGFQARATALTAIVNGDGNHGCTILIGQRFECERPSRVRRRISHCRIRNE